MIDSLSSLAWVGGTKTDVFPAESSTPDGVPGAAHAQAAADGGSVNVEKVKAPVIVVTGLPTSSHKGPNGKPVTNDRNTVDTILHSTSAGEDIAEQNYKTDDFRLATYSWTDTGLSQGFIRNPQYDGGIDYTSSYDFGHLAAEASTVHVQCKGWDVYDQKVDSNTLTVNFHQKYENFQITGPAAEAEHYEFNPASGGPTDPSSLEPVDGGSFTCSYNYFPFDPDDMEVAGAMTGVVATASGLADVLSDGWVGVLNVVGGSVTAGTQCVYANTVTNAPISCYDIWQGATQVPNSTFESVFTSAVNSSQADNINYYSQWKMKLPVYWQSFYKYPSTADNYGTTGFQKVVRTELSVLYQSGYAGTFVHTGKIKK